jgi:hypothetical protein
MVIYPFLEQDSGEWLSSGITIRIFVLSSIKSVFPSLMYCKSVTFISHISFGANQPLNHGN